VGYSQFTKARSNGGHVVALARMEEMGVIGVDLMVGEEVLDCLGESCYGSLVIDEDDDGDNVGGGDRVNTQQQSGKRRLSIITQNVDILHSKGGSKHVLHLHSTWKG